MFIKTREELNHVLDVEVGKMSLKTFFFQPYNKQFLKSLRMLEFHSNNKGPYHFLMSFLWHIRYRRLAVLTGLNIPINVCGEGLTIYHTGCITVNTTCKIGKNCCIHNNVNIGASGGRAGAPKIGDNVYIGPGAVIFGDISIADGCFIGANAVVNKSCLEPNSVIVGVPGNVVKKDYIFWWKKNGLKRQE